MYLSPVIYEFIQKSIIGTGVKSVRRFIRFMNLKPGDEVIDFGCGTGIISNQFVKYGIKYKGFDLDTSRIEYAKKKYNDREFYCGDIANYTNKFSFKNVVAHGVLHHMSDQDVYKFIHFLKTNGCQKFGCMEPILPERWYHNPLGYFVCKMDDGKYVRHLHEYNRLFQGEVQRIQTDTFRWLFWPSRSLILVVEFSK